MLSTLLSLIAHEHTERVEFTVTQLYRYNMQTGPDLKEILRYAGGNFQGPPYVHILFFKKQNTLTAMIIVA